MPHANRSKSPQQRSGVFISYARSDGEAFAHRLRQRLEEQNIPLWQDSVGMEGGRDWWLQITEALDNVAFMALVVTPNALKSEIVRKEWRYARQQGVCVYPINGAPNLNFESQPRWMRDQHFYDLGSLEGQEPGPEWQKFLNDLNKTPDIRRVPFMVEDMPAGFVQRPNEFDQLVALLIEENREEPVAITVALRGAGGYGKTTIAKALCHDEQIQDAFDDGILWVTLGENPGDLIGRVEDLIQTLSGERPGFSKTEAAIARMKELLADRDILIVIDDVWNRDHLRPFMQGGSRCARLITTRKLSVLPVGIPDVVVSSMSYEEATAMLRANLAEHEGEYSQNELPVWSQKLGKWPLLLRLVNDELRRRCARGHLLPSTMNYIKEQFEEIGITALDNERVDLTDRNRSVARSIETSLRELTEEEGARFAELAVFDLNKPIPTATLELYWALTGNFSKIKIIRFCDRLHDLSLVYYFDTKYFSILIPQAIHRFLQDQHKNEITKFRDNLLTCLVQF